MVSQVVAEILAATVLTLGSPQSAPALNYTCQEPRWEAEPARTEKLFSGKMSAVCVIYPKWGGDFMRLQTYAIDQLKSRGQILTGPFNETYAGLPSLFLTYRLPIQTEDLSMTLWQDIHVGTDGTSKWISTTESSLIKGTGSSEYLKKADTSTVITRINPGEDHAVVTFYAEFEKPWYATEGVFLRKLKELVPEHFARIRDQVMQEASQNY